MSEIRLHNTLTHRVEPFRSLEPGFVGIYSCGPTVYSEQHLGNMRPYWFADTLKRMFMREGYRVRHVINITDVGHLTDDADAGEDKVEAAARREGLSAWEVAEKWTRVFKEDLKKLNIPEPDVWCKATDHIPDQIELIRELERKGFTYSTSDGVYFDTSRAPRYGELTGVDLGAQRVGERVAGAGEKRNPADFALWKLSPTRGARRQMEWESPWGLGFPGWHIECSAMSSKYLGVPFDVHTGGVDHIPVHHTNEIAQSEAAFGVRPWVRYWLHEEWLLFEGEKISKSSGGVITLSELEAEGIEPLAFRLFLLGAHYRQQQTFTRSAIEGARTAYRRLVRHAVDLRDARDRRGGAAAVEVHRQRFRGTLLDDLNTPQALAVLWDVTRSTELGGAEKWELLCEFDSVLGLGLAEARLENVELDAEVEALVRKREAARSAKDFARSDEIRAELARMGIVLEDTKDGTRWRRG